MSKKRKNKKAKITETESRLNSKIDEIEDETFIESKIKIVNRLKY